MFYFALILFIILFFFRPRPQPTQGYNIPTTVNETIPRTIILTTRDKTNIPKHIHEQYEKYAKGYQLLIFDDNECESFLNQEYPPEVLQKFRSFSAGAHKADLFRYAYLLKHGGIYLDVKTILMMDLNEIVDHTIPTCYLVYTDNNRLFNGILCTPPRNEYFLKLFNDIVYGPTLTHYMQFCESAARILHNDYMTDGSFTKGLQRTTGRIPRVILWKEIFCDSDKHCNKKSDRYGFCNFCIDETDKKLFKIRDDTYGKTWN